LVPFYGDYLIPIAIFGLLGLFVVFAGEPWFERGGLVAALISILLWLPMVRWDGSKENQEVANSRRNVAAAAAAIQDLTRPGDEVLSFWSGYLVGTHATILPGMLDGQAVELMNGKLSQEEHHRYGVASREDILAWIETRRPALIVVSFASPAGFEDLVSRKYRLARVAGQARLYVR
jgi:hypothetical protein